MGKLKEKVQSFLEDSEWRLLTKHFVLFGYLIILLVCVSDVCNKMLKKKKEEE
jgi:hypothetical protein